MILSVLNAFPRGPSVSATASRIAFLIPFREKLPGAVKASDDRGWESVTRYTRDTFFLGGFHRGSAATTLASCPRQGWGRPQGRRGRAPCPAARASNVSIGAPSAEPCAAAQASNVSRVAAARKAAPQQVLYFYSDTPRRSPFVLCFYSDTQ